MQIQRVKIGYNTTPYAYVYRVKRFSFEVISITIASTHHGEEIQHRRSVPSKQERSRITYLMVVIMWKLSILSALLSLTNSEAFAPSHNRLSSVTVLGSSEAADDILKPKYEIESIPIRIGHGFDIHKMAPIGDAGQPVVIGGVEIPHKDQKVRTRMNEITPFSA